MVFGLQKLTLLDYPGVVACTLFTGSCNFRCPFCHNGSLAKGEIAGKLQEVMLPEEEIFSFLKKRSGLLDGVCITGGEPLLYQEIVPVIRRIREMGYKVKLDTNGSFPERLSVLLEEKLVDYVAMDIKNSPEKYAVTAGNDKILVQVQTSAALLKKNLVPYEFRTTVTGKFHREEDFIAIGKWIQGAEKYFLQPFVESEDILIRDPGYGISNEELQKFLAAVKQYVPGAAVRGR